MGEQGGVEEGEFGGLGVGWGVAGGGRVSACMTEGRRRRRLNEGFDPSVIAAPRRKENTHAHTQLTTQHNPHTHARAEQRQGSSRQPAHPKSPSGMRTPALP